MVETTFKIGFPAAGDCEIESNVSGELEEQAENVAFAYYAAQTISVLGPARAGALLEALTDSGNGMRRQATSRDHAAGTFRVITRFIDGASGPRMYFRVTSSEPGNASESVHVLHEALLRRRPGAEEHAARLDFTAELVGRLGATGQIRPDNEFDVALAAADVGWRFAGAAEDQTAFLDVPCPACSNTHADAGFELRVWPSETAVIRKCARCGAGVWKRESRRPRLLRGDIWSGMETMRADLRTLAHPEAPADGGGSPLFDELKRAFAENGWPYSEVRGAPVLVGELAGPAGRWSFYAQAVEEQDLILVYSICPRRVPEERRDEISRFLTRVNYGLAAGNFELDFADGEVRYKTVLHLQGDELDRLAVRRLVRANGITMETYLPDIGSVIEGTPPG